MNDYESDIYIILLVLSEYRCKTNGGVDIRELTSQLCLNQIYAVGNSYNAFHARLNH